MVAHSPAHDFLYLQSHNGSLFPGSKQVLPPLEQKQAVTVGQK
jgi:hypothetical protein